MIYLQLAERQVHNIPDGVVSDDHKSPSVTIGQRTKLPGKTETPAPNNYDVNVGMGTRYNCQCDETILRCLRRWLQPRFDFDLTGIRMGAERRLNRSRNAVESKSNRSSPFDSHSTAIRPRYDLLRYGPPVLGCCTEKKRISHRNLVRCMGAHSLLAL